MSESASLGRVDLWTIQPKHVWELLAIRKTLYSEPSLGWAISAWPRAYDWMREQMTARIRNSSGRYPWWGWYQPKPDLRRWRYWTEYEAEMVRITLSLRREEVLLSVFSAWEMALGQGYVAKTYAEHEAWEKSLLRSGINEDQRPLPKPWQSRLEKSWGNVFDLEGLAGGDAWSCDRIQATFETLRLDDVTSTTFFHARPALAFS